MTIFSVRALPGRSREDQFSVQRSVLCLDISSRCRRNFEQGCPLFYRGAQNALETELAHGSSFRDADAPKFLKLGAKTSLMFTAASTPP